MTRSDTGLYLQAGSAREWKDSLTDYAELTFLRFSSKEDFRWATRLLFSIPELSGMPYRGLGMYGIIIPSKAHVVLLGHIAAKHIECDVQPVQRVNDLPAERAAYIREQAGFIYG